MPEEDYHEDCCGDEVGSLEELVAKTSVESSAFAELMWSGSTYRNGPHEAKVSQAWNRRATIPVQYSKILLTVN